MPDHAVGVGPYGRVARPRAGLPEDRCRRRRSPVWPFSSTSSVPSTTFPARDTASTSLSSHGTPSAATSSRRLGELDVDRDRASDEPAAIRSITSAWWQRGSGNCAGRPRAQVVERHVVDRDDDDVGRRPRREPRTVKARVDGRLARASGTRGRVREQRDRDRDRGDDAEASGRRCRAGALVGGGEPGTTSRSSDREHRSPYFGRTRTLCPARTISVFLRAKSSTATTPSLTCV